MKRIAWVAWFEYQKNVFKKSFLWALFIFPLIIALLIGMVAIIILTEDDPKPVGYVDFSGVLSDPLPVPAGEEEDLVQMLPFMDEESAKTALMEKTIQAYFVLPEGYPANRQAKLVYLNRVGNNARQQFNDFLQRNLLREYPAQVTTRAVEGNDISLRLLGKTTEFGASTPSLTNLLPLFITISFIFLVLVSTGYLMSAVAEEKENRTMEILATTISPSRLIAGKILGIVGIGLTLLLCWIVFGILAIAVGGSVLDMPFFQDFQIDWQGVLIVLAIGIPSYVMASGLMVVIGSTVAQPSEGQTAGSLFMLAFILPIYFLQPLIENPANPLGLAFSHLPFTSLLAITFRSVFMYVPPWQILTSFILQVVYAAAAIWLASRAFRLGLLRYGKSIKLREILHPKPQEGTLP